MSNLSEVKEEVVTKVTEAAEAVSEAVEKKADEVKAAVQEKTEEVKTEVQEKAEAAREALEEKAEEARAKAEELKEAVAEKTEEVKEAAEAKAEEVKEAAQEKKAEAGESMEDLKEELEASLKQGPPTDDPVWARFEELLESKEAIPVKIDSAVKGGVITYVDGVRAFIPASKAALNRVEDLETLKGVETEAIVVTAEKKGNKLVLSVRDALRNKEKAEKEARLAECVEGAVMEGTVDSVMDYGAFIKLDNGVSGLLHVSQISYERVAKPSDVLKKGDRVTVKIIAVKDGKISLSKKALEEAPARKERAPRENRPDREPREDRPRRERRDKEEVFNYKETRKASTNLGDLLSGIKLDD